MAEHDSVHGGSVTEDSPPTVVLAPRKGPFLNMCIFCGRMVLGRRRIERHVADCLMSFLGIEGRKWGKE